MANDVKIIISAVDKASKELNKVNKELGGMEASGKKAGLSLNQIGAAIGTVTAVTGAVIGAAIAIKGLADHYMEYGMQVRQVMTELGASAEEASKLIQVADDVAIGFETMVTAMRAAIRKGLQPTIEEIGNLSDAYLKLAPGIDRTKFLLDTFGRSGADIARIMELGSTKINEMGKSIEGTALLMTKEGVEAADKYRGMLDILNDRIEAVKLSMGEKVIPGMTGGLEDVIDTMDRFAIVQGAMEEGLIGLGDAIKYLFMIDMDEDDWIRGLAELKRSTEEARTELSLLAREMDFQAETDAAWANLTKVDTVVEELAEDLPSTTQKVDALAEAINKAGGMAAYAAKWNKTWLESLDVDFGGTIANMIKSMEYADLGGVMVQTLYDEIIANMGPLGEVGDAMGKELLAGLLLAWESMQIQMGTNKWDALADLKSKLKDLVPKETYDRLIALFKLEGADPEFALEQIALLQEALDNLVNPPPIAGQEGALERLGMGTDTVKTNAELAKEQFVQIDTLIRDELNAKELTTTVEKIDSITAKAALISFSKAIAGAKTLAGYLEDARQDLAWILANGGGGGGGRGGGVSTTTTWPSWMNNPPTPRTTAGYAAPVVNITVNEVASPIATANAVLAEYTRQARMAAASGRNYAGSL